MRMPGGWFRSSSTLQWGRGQVCDGTAAARLVGLRLFRCQVYGSAQGRFTSPDPMLKSAKATQSMSPEKAKAKCLRISLDPDDRSIDSLAGLSVEQISNASGDLLSGLTSVVAALGFEFTAKYGPAQRIE